MAETITINSVSIISEKSPLIFTDKSFTMRLGIKNNSTQYAIGTIAVSKGMLSSTNNSLCGRIQRESLIAKNSTAYIDVVCTLPQEYIDSISENRVVTDNPFRINVVWVGGQAGGSYPLRVYTDPFTFITQRYSPSITRFEAERYDRENELASDESGDIRVFIDAGAASACDLTFSLYSGGVEDISKRVVWNTSEYTDGVLWVSFPASDDCELRLFYGDQYESSAMRVSVPRAFANVHLSGATYVENSKIKQIGGVAFGKFSSVQSTGDVSGKNTGKFECAYPAYFENGIYDGNGAPIGGAAITDAEIACGSINGVTVYRRAFSVSQIPFMTTLKTTTLPDGLSVGLVLRAYGGFTDGTKRIAVGANNAGSQYCQCFFPSATQISTRCYFNATDGRLVLEYTKNS